MLKDRITKERREAQWDSKSREAIANASKTLEEFDAAHLNPNQVQWKCKLVIVIMKSFQYNENHVAICV